VRLADTPVSARRKRQSQALARRTIEALQVEALCWCGARATHHARTVGGEMVVEGTQVVVGDITARWRRSVTRSCAAGTTSAG
jgi:thymidine kinase